MTVVGAGVAAVAIAGTSVLGSVYAVTVPPPAAPATVIAAPQQRDERAQRTELTSRDTERITPAATPTGMVTSTPTPSPTPVVDDTDQEPSPLAPTVSATGNTGAGGGSLPTLLVTIRANESGGNYSAYNPSGCQGYGCGGAYQLHAQYASAWAAEAGYPGMPSNAAEWPPEIQDAVALYKFNQTGGGLWCDWVDYC